MWINFCNAFVKITGWPVQLFCFRTKVYREDPAVQGRRISGPAIIVSNHTSVFDYVVWLFVFFSRTLRFQMAELLFERKPLGTLLRCLGGIRVNRYTHDLSFMARSEDIIRAGGIVGIFPEGRIPRVGEARPLPFSSGAAYLALSTGAPIVPVFTNGSYFCKKRARVMIGTPIDAAQLVEEGMSEKEALVAVTEGVRQHIIELGNELNERIAEE